VHDDSFRWSNRENSESGEKQEKVIGVAGDG
jgi:hypothetical protein